MSNDLSENTLPSVAASFFSPRGRTLPTCPTAFEQALSARGVARARVRLRVRVRVS